jgi:hypothetical protein
MSVYTQTASEIASRINQALPGVPQTALQALFQPINEALLGTAVDLAAVTSTAAELNILDGVTATAPEINMAADNSANVEVVAATNVITAAESGKTFFLASATEFVSTLPAVAAGLRYTFYVSAAPVGASYTIVAASGTPIIGHVVTTDVDSATNPGFNTSGVLTITLVDGKAVKGDCVELICDGTNWYARAECSVFDAITFS